MNHLVFTLSVRRKFLAAIGQMQLPPFHGNQQFLNFVHQAGCRQSGNAPLGERKINRAARIRFLLTHVGAFFVYRYVVAPLPQHDRKQTTGQTGSDDGDFFFAQNGFLCFYSAKQCFKISANRKQSSNEL